jgi:uncharacterized phiE125 gp8 family phage protein
MNYILGDITITSDLVTEPVLVSDAKDYMKITFDTDDIIIDGLISSSRRLLEKYTGVSFGAKTITLFMEVNDEWVDLPYGPVGSITSVTRFDAIDSSEVLTANEDYKLVNGRLYMGQCGNFTIVYVTANTIKDDLKSDIYRLVAYMYANRGIQFEAEDSIRQFPDWTSLNAHYYAKVVI